MENSGIDRCKYVLTSLEDVLGIHSYQGRESLESLPIDTFLKLYKPLIESKRNKETIKEVKSNMMKLSYIDAVSMYEKETLLDFRKHKRVDLLATLLSYFRTSKITLEQIKDNFTSIVSYLSLLDNKNRNMVNSLSYRYVRIVLILILLEDYCSCSVVSNFIINQIFLGEGIFTAIRNKINSNRKARKKVEKLSEQYKEERENFNGSDYEDVDVSSNIKTKIDNVKKSSAGFVNIAKEKVGENILKFSKDFRIPTNLNSRKEVDMSSIDLETQVAWETMSDSRKNEINRKLILILGNLYMKSDKEFYRWITNEISEMKKTGIVKGLKEKEIKQAINKELYEVLSKKAPFIWRNRTKSLEKSLLEEWSKLCKEG